MPKLYTGDNIRQVIAANKNKWTTAETPYYIIIYPAPALYLKPIRPQKAIVFFKRLTAAPARYPGGCFTAKQYTISADKSTLPNKYMSILRDSLSQ